MDKQFLFIPRTVKGKKVEKKRAATSFILKKNTNSPGATSSICNDDVEEGVKGVLSEMVNNTSDLPRTRSVPVSASVGQYVPLTGAVQPLYVPVIQHPCVPVIQHQCVPVIQHQCVPVIQHQYAYKPSSLQHVDPLATYARVQTPSFYQRGCSFENSDSRTDLTYQNAPTLVDMGPLSTKPRIPVYQRKRRKGKPKSNIQPRQCYTGLAWEPTAAEDADNNKNSHAQSGGAFGYPRYWEYTEKGKWYTKQPVSRRGFDFTVMSYNILAQNLLEDNFFLYEDSPPYVLEWKYRQKLLLDEFRYHSPDIICLQEVNQSHYLNFFKPELHKLGYDSAYVKRTADKLDGCATFYRRSKFTLDKSIPIQYYHPQGGNVLDRDNVALILKLIPIIPQASTPSNRRLCVANTHLLFNPRRGDVKLAQLMVLLSEMDKCAFINDPRSPDLYHALIMCGDYNSEPQSEIYKFLVMGALKYEGLSYNMLSGQKEALMGGKNRGYYLHRNFFPPEVGIDDQCQYCDEVRKRNRKVQRKSGGSKNKHKHFGGSKNVQPGHSKTDNVDSDDDVKITTSQGTGFLQHKLSLVPTYEHWIARHNYHYKEVTTFHGRADCTVDYIFYGVRSRLVRFKYGEVQMKDMVEGQLSLLGRYGLLSSHELADLGSLPNSQLGSDHVSIMSKFLMN